MEATFFDEVAADKEVIKSLTREIERLKGLIMLRTIVKTVEGKFYDVTDSEELSLEQVNEIVMHVNNEAAELNALVAGVAPETNPTPEQPVAPEQPAQPETPAEQLVHPPQPADPTQPAGDNPNPSPADPSPTVTLA